VGEPFGYSTTTTEGNVTQIALRGDLKEGAVFPVVDPSTRRLILDLGGISRINSLGVREWMRFAAAIPETVETLLERCPVVFVSQSNMIANFLGRSRVVSFIAPYVCERCDSVADVLLVCAQENVAQLMKHAPARNCEKCGNALTFDELEESYFAFLKNC
jgi:hypothetical protein